MHCRYDVAMEASGHPATAAFYKTDPWLQHALPEWSPPARSTSNATIPFMSGFSAVRILGGLALHHANNDTYTPLPEYDIVTRDPSNASQCTLCMLHDRCAL